ncbi:MAG: hypothetical protein ACO2ZP_04965 [Bacteriovoracaceae bacterium]
MSGKMSRNKGASYEREVARKFREFYPEAKRNVTECQQGQGIDILDTGPLDIQCKRKRKYSPITAIEEVPRVEGRIPVLITRGDNKEDVACLYLKDFLAILKGLYCNCQSY